MNGSSENVLKVSGLLRVLLCRLKDSYRSYAAINDYGVYKIWNQNKYELLLFVKCCLSCSFYCIRLVLILSSSLLSVQQMAATARAHFPNLVLRCHHVQFLCLVQLETCTFHPIHKLKIMSGLLYFIFHPRLKAIAIHIYLIYNRYAVLFTISIRVKDIICNIFINVF
uniref:Uncharacterized protein n=1 Tax=Heterorhabditis bacteriophora TaxID=37862 RepID=A0A1I7WKA2_HETBA